MLGWFSEEVGRDALWRSGDEVLVWWDGVLGVVFEGSYAMVFEIGADVDVFTAVVFGAVGHPCRLCGGPVRRLERCGIAATADAAATTTATATATATAAALGGADHLSLGQPRPLGVHA